MKILVIDNYDSFTYNLVHYLEKVTDARIDVFRNDKIKLEEIEQYDKILLSPGPGIPSEAGILLDVIKKYAPTKSIFGVCLGQQAIAEAFGGSISNLKEVFHGVATPATILIEDAIFKNVPKQLKVGRYHSWAVNKEDLPKELEITAVDESGSIMAIRHKTYDLSAVQFHPESVLTEHGLQMIENWVNKK
ncbi:MAG TPA: aminodeoxychorismate/anthranilate synthase component II [Bacteroidia bacterium]|jgi:anthranilate synthase component 2|nr:aminodeoxychorismate/anthranilate synthase component II [Bacteroidia bacterium]HRG52685.1 aminodeoxychorismate/anthranilate synthase component II [Bacteroidia bacterium]